VDYGELGARTVHHGHQFQLLGIWQAIDFWELRTAGSTRMLTLHLLGDGGDGRPWRLGPCFHGASPW